MGRFNLTIEEVSLVTAFRKLTPAERLGTLRALDAVPFEPSVPDGLRANRTGNLSNLSYSAEQSPFVHREEAPEKIAQGHR